MPFESLVTISNLTDLSFISGRDIWLSLEEESELKMDNRNQLMELDWLNLKEIQSYQSQLFYWLLIRRSQSPVNVELMMTCPELFQQALNN